MEIYLRRNEERYKRRRPSTKALSISLRVSIKYQVFQLQVAYFHLPIREVAARKSAGQYYDVSARRAQRQLYNRPVHAACDCNDDDACTTF